MKLFTQAGLGWLGRRVLDWGGWLGTTGVSLVTLYNSLPPTTQTAIQHAWEGHWQDITLGSLVPIAALVFSQVQSYRATVKPAMVTTDGTKTSLDKMADVAPQTVAHAEQAARTVAVNKPDGPVISILKGIFGK